MYHSIAVHVVPTHYPANPCALSLPMLNLYNVYIYMYHSIAVHVVPTHYPANPCALSLPMLNLYNVYIYNVMYHSIAVCIYSAYTLSCQPLCLESPNVELIQCNYMYHSIAVCILKHKCLHIILTSLVVDCCSSCTQCLSTS